MLGNPTTASQYQCCTNIIYTFNTIDEFLDLADYRLSIPIEYLFYDRANQECLLRAVTNAEDSDNVRSLF